MLSGSPALLPIKRGPSRVAVVASGGYPPPTLHTSIDIPAFRVTVERAVPVQDSWCPVAALVSGNLAQQAVSRPCCLIWTPVTCPAELQVALLSPYGAAIFLRILEMKLIKAVCGLVALLVSKACSVCAFLGLGAMHP